MSVAEHPTLRALLDRVIPADAEFPSCVQAGAEEFLRRTLDPATAAELAVGLSRLDDWVTAAHDTAFPALESPVQDALIAELATGPWPGAAEFIARVIALAMQSYYGDPGNGGNRDAVGWRMIGYHPVQRDWPSRPSSDLPTIEPDRIAEHYDAIVVGAGAGGGVLACLLAEAGRRVLLVERGSWIPVDQPADHLRNQRSVLGYETPAGPPLAGNPRVIDGPLTITPADSRWSNNAMTLGGGTRVFGAQAWRFSPEDFRMASTYGVPAGSSLADWPIDYAELEPYYDRAEWELGVCGSVGGNSADGPRRRGYPMPPLPETASSRALSAGAKELGWTAGPVPLLINSRPYGDRPTCVQCGTCVGFSCRVDAKNGTHNTVIPRALATGDCDLALDTQVTKVLTDSAGQANGVRLADGREIRADQIVLCAGAVETARLLLASGSIREPDGLGNNHDLVGRQLQGHVYTGAVATFDRVVQECVGPGPTISTNDFRHHNPGLIGGGMLANDFVPTPLNQLAILTGLGLIPRWGAAGKSGMRELYSRSTLVMGPIQEIPNPQARVRLATLTDTAGMPVARLSGAIHLQDRRTAAFLRDRAVEWLRASGASTVMPLPDTGPGPSGGQHQAGTCRMGTEPGSSVTDPYGRVWGQRNLHIADASLHVTNGGVNPVLTVLANAYRIGEAMLRGD